MAEKQSEIQDLIDKISLADVIIRDNYDNLDDPEFELGVLSALNSISYELKNKSPIKAIKNYINSHYEWILQLEKQFIESANENSKHLQIWAEPVSNRIADELDCLKENIPDRDLFQKTLQKLFMHNPSLIEPLIGTSIIEEDYFSKLS
jgi:hypothetical protein